MKTHMNRIQKENAVSAAVGCINIKQKSQTTNIGKVHNRYIARQLIVMLRNIEICND